MRNYTVIRGVFCWITRHKDGTGNWQPLHHTAHPGDVLTLGEVDAVRGLEAGILAPVEDAEEAAAAVAADTGLVSDEELAHMKVEEITAYLVQHPDEARRVWEAERRRAKPRATVLQATGIEPDIEQH
ncbi:hypothetical protein DI270_017370 [Microbispora triticiradicis]|uniref:Uncharacterized protein n=1 Tax=Microbispora triticiradicis TaxID=2200763 RepID=A0ABX9LJ54_9ACTN|nr:hypothetical protein [Microbispora triticiradicis]RGA03661.1 hypothetical protein DI270_017370 [Microbispora triticiradicis]GLW22943.1 hypothetical protein Mame01_29860 [Microbispora amethystogenes]